jgi:RNA polymerase sigma-54 factor
MQKLETKLKLSTRLSPQQIQFIRLLQIPTSEIENRIEEELAENPVLQKAENNADDMDDSNLEEINFNNREDFTTKNQLQENNTNEKESPLEEYLTGPQSEDDYNYKMRIATDPNEESYEAPIVQLSSLFDLLKEQVDTLALDPLEVIIAEQIIGNIDEDGYFRRPIEALVNEMAFRLNLTVEAAQIESVLHMIQQLEPPGIGARNLQECLLLQLDRQRTSTEVRLAKKIIRDYFEEFAKKHFDRLIDRLEITPEEFKKVYELIKRLNPKPGESQSNIQHQYIVPDFIVTVDGDNIDIKLNRKNAPDLKVSKEYKRMLKELHEAAQKNKSESTKHAERDQQALQFVKNKIDSAEWFIDALKQRQITLLNVMNEIVEQQRAFFLSEGDEHCLKPMILKDIAEKVGMDISTISRVANSKYVQTDHKIYPLKFFFSEGIQTDSGDEVSNREVKKILRQLIDAEDKKKPLSDDRLAEILNEKGYNIARRTVAKYREMMEIPVARLRKEV